MWKSGTVFDKIALGIANCLPQVRGSPLNDGVGRSRVRTTHALATASLDLRTHCPYYSDRKIRCESNIPIMDEELGGTLTLILTVGLLNYVTLGER